MTKRIAVTGAGTMGSGIAVSLAIAGYEVALFDCFSENEEIKYRAEANIRRSLLSVRNLSKNEVVNRIKFFDIAYDIGEVFFCEAVIEAIYENLNQKKRLYSLIRQVAGLYHRGPIPIFSNTSTIQCSRLVEGMQDPEHFMVLHFFSPVPMSKVVEFVPHKNTNEETLRLGREIVERMNKKDVPAPDVPGFVVNRMLLPMLQVLGEILDSSGLPVDKINFVTGIDAAFKDGTWPVNPDALAIVTAMIRSAQFLLADNNADRLPPELEAMAFAAGAKTDDLYRHSSIRLSPEKIDQMVVLATGFPAGPFELERALAEGTANKYKFRMGPGQLADFVGIDVAADCLGMLEDQEVELWEVPQVFTNMVNDGKRGMKSGQGFYQYEVSVNPLVKSGCIEISIESPSLSHSTVKRLQKILIEIGTLQNISESMVVIRIDKLRGADICEFPSAFGNLKYLEGVLNDWHKLMNLIHGFPCPVIAVVDRLAVGGGYELALACDYIISGKNAKIGLPEIKLGILPGGGGTQNLPRRVGLAKALRTILGGEMVTAEIPWVDKTVGSTDAGAVVEELVTLSIKKKERGPVKYTGPEWIEASETVASMRDEWNDEQPASFDLAVDAICQGSQKDIASGMREDEFTAVLSVFKTDSPQERILHFLEHGKYKFEPKK